MQCQLNSVILISVSMWATMESRTDVSVQSGELFAQIHTSENYSLEQLSESDVLKIENWNFINQA